MDYSSPAFIEWVVLNFILVLVSVVLLGKYYKEKRVLKTQGLLND